MFNSLASVRNRSDGLPTISNSNRGASWRHKGKRVYSLRGNGSPSHSWRHQIKTLGRRHGLAKDILEAITGHGQKSVADSYGEFPMEALFRELKKIPALDLKVTKIPDQR